uniref:Lmo2812 protein n=1 Tax=Listeria monocytogenes serovar 1/2a (strain ATCC BAA-679 / EGD-e) TaxID=169963 RepID=UPI000DF0CE57|nr:Chain A, Lmo2812 protein [Listeria monocytogenes EGD-e]5ZQB_A Chain A, Lmo2812 protein [Listeria monocytogenes EGD-e]5ZQB_B Chain B, Lmo2812 protein [Listeria monocytogenes EGD-e]5ZQB_C Chain C, Lmo2812 protein [Listeria monocytogenes EGD-e]5ZQB_D Chain D, Lmo2812 protein [Listeria monocytogenes EGD-e]5ZQC_A Chain A, Lmo2812 protein [Listeria monocytogenes EGD-e]5ZQC_B Chain B, Lmo2812 protein [Listeria monocytogenes EGD-e]5ZQC_C Chain C, Lmo2812 protein [Listeria monocytogenes EGD-e]5ZQ
HHHHHHDYDIPTTENLYFQGAMGSSTEQPNLYLSANAAAVYSVENGEALYEQNADKVMPIASLSKLMTAFLVLEAVDNNELSWDEKLDLVRLDDPSAVSLYAITQKRTWSVRDLYSAMLTMSANDAAETLGDRLDGADFPKEMNNQAKKLGMSSKTTFVSASGLDVDGKSAVSTTKDLFLLSSKLISTHPEVLETTSKPTVTTDKGAKLESTNDLLGSIQGLDGLKTGFTDEAGYCFIGTAERGGKRVISIVLDAGTAEKRFKDTEKLMEVGFKED